MSTAKEKVLTYFEEWDGKGINTANGCDALIDKSLPQLYQICMDGAYGWTWNTSQNRPEEHFEFAARILKLDKPRVAEIQWRELITGDAHAGEGGYLVEQRGTADWAAYFQSIRFEDRFYPTLEAAKKACQDHKQGRLEKLL